MPVVFIRHIGSNLALIEPVGAVDPGWGGGIGAGTDPGYGHPIFGPHPGHGLPGAPVYPSNGLPGSPGHPDNRPPATRPPVVAAGQTLVLVRDPVGVWHYATVDATTPPPKPVPVPPPTTPDNTLPPAPAPKA